MNNPSSAHAGFENAKEFNSDSSKKSYKSSSLQKRNKNLNDTHSVR